MTMSKIDNIDETISDPELSDIEDKLMQEAVSKGKNVRIRVRSKKRLQNKREA